jgi:large subunit ribosomal protein L22
MEVSAKLRYARVTPRKLGLLCDEIRGKGINDALTFLKVSPRKRSAGMLHCLLKSAVSNADQKGTVDVDTLYVKRIFVGPGPILKRFKPRAKGAADRMEKKTSHVTVFLSEK